MEQHKKVLLFLMMAMFLISFASALETDNRGFYNEETKTIIVKNAFGLGEQIGGATLLTPQNFKVGAGYDYIAEFYLWADQDYNDIIKNLNLYNKHYSDWENHKIQRDVDFKYRTTKIDQVPIYGNENSFLNENGTIEYEQVVVGYEEREVEEWKKLTPASLKKGEVLIVRIYTDIKVGDHGEWILELFGVRVDEWAEWTQNLNTDIIQWLNFEETGGSVAVDEVGNYNGTIVGGVALGLPGRIGKSYYYDDGSGEYVSFAVDPITAYTNFTVSFFLKDNAYIPWTVRQSGTTNGNICTNFDTDDGNWHHVVVTRNGNNMEFFVDNVSYGTNSASFTSLGIDYGFPTANRLCLVKQASSSGSGTRIGYLAASTNTSIDLYGLWSRVLSDGEIGQLYNSGLGIIYDTNIPPNMTLNAPTNNTTVANPSVVFNMTGTDDTGIANMSLIVNDSYISTNSSVYNNTLTKFQHTIPSGGFYTWKGEVCDQNASCVNTSEFYITYQNNLNITIHYPQANAKLSTQSNLFNGTAKDDTAVLNVSILINGIINQTNSSVYNNTVTTFNVTLPQGVYNWSMETCDIYSCINSGNRTVTIHVSPATVEIIEPYDIVNYIAIGQNQTIRWNVTEAGVNLSEHIKECLYSYDGTTYNITGVCVTANISNFTYIDGVNFVNMSVEEDFGLVTKANKSWRYNFIEKNRIYDTAGLQTGSETFVLVLEKDASILSSSAVLTYDGGNYTSVRTSSGQNVNFTNIVSIPTNLSGNVTFYWTIDFTNATGSYQFNTSSSTQEIFNLTLQECFAPSIDGLTLNFTTYDSTNLTELNSSLEATFQFYSESGEGEIIEEYLFSDLNENRSNYMYCINSSGQNVTLDAFISYIATDYDRREYIIDDGIIGNFTQNIPLYLTETALTDIVTITVQDQSYDPITGALVAVQEWNIGTNTYSTIGMLTTSSSGQGIIDLELYTTWYRAVVSIEGVISEVTDVQKLSSTSWIITVQTGEDNPYDLFGNIAHGLTFDNQTNITSFTWLDNSGYTSDGCLVVQNTTSLGMVTVFNSCVSSVSGTVDYYIQGQGEYLAYGIIYLQGYNQSEIVETLPIRIGTPEMTKKVSPFGKVISFISIGTAGLIGVSAGSAVLGGILLIAALIGLMKFGFLNIAWGFIWGIISIVILVWILQRRKR